MLWKIGLRLRKNVPEWLIVLARGRSWFSLSLSAGDLMWRGVKMQMVAMALLVYCVGLILWLVVRQVASKDGRVPEPVLTDEERRRNVVVKEGFKVVRCSVHGEVSPAYRDSLKTWPKTRSVVNGWTWSSLGEPSALLGLKSLDELDSIKLGATTIRLQWVDSNSFKSGAHKSIPDRAGLRPSDTAKVDCQLAKLGLWGSRAFARGPHTLGDYFDHTHPHFWTKVQI